MLPADIAGAPGGGEGGLVTGKEMVGFLDIWVCEPAEDAEDLACILENIECPPAELV